MATRARDPLQHTSMYERNLDDSEESDGEGGLGNVNRMVMRPAGHSGKAKKGHLCFDASFETGNLGRVDLVSEYEYDLFIRPDTCCPKLRMWFNFVVDNVKQDQRVIFNIVNFGKAKNLYNTEMTPIVKSTSRPKWQRLKRCNVFYHRSIYHRFRHVLSFAFAFDKEDDVYHFALSTPYSYSKEQAYLDVWMKKAKNLKESVEREIIGKSIQKRKIDLITIENKPIEEQPPPDVKTKKEKKKVVVVISRIHGGEPPASFICQGFMDFLISPHSMAQLLRKKVIFKIIPMLNPDGVHLGNQRSNLMGLDLNRSWNTISQWAHPTLKVAYDVIKKLDTSKEYVIDFIIDIHAHTSLKGCFIYGNSYDDVYRFERHVVFPKIFASKAEGFCTNNVLYNSDSSKAGTARRFFCTNLANNNSNAFTLMVSLGGYHLPSTSQYIHYNDEAYLRVGRNLAKSLYTYYKQINVIEPPVKSDDKKKTPKGRRRKENKFKHRRHKSTPSPRPQQCLEPRIFSPSIIKPDPPVELSQNPIYEYPPILTKFHSKRLGNTNKQLYQDEELPGAKYIVRCESPIPSLSIIDLNNTIRCDLKQSNQKPFGGTRLSKIDEWNIKKKEYLIRLSQNKSTSFSSDEDTD